MTRGHFLKGIWQRAFGKGHFPKEQVEPTQNDACYRALVKDDSSLNEVILTAR